MNTQASSNTAAQKRRPWWRVLRSLLLIYIVWCGLLYFQQDAMVFPVSQIPGSHAAPPPAAIVLQRDTEEGISRAWLFPAPHASAEKPAPLVIFFHGNAERIDHQTGLVADYQRRGLSVLLPEYRGYGHSDGKPSQRGIVADAIAFYDRVTQREDVDASRIILHGRSLGTAVAAQLAAQRSCIAFIGESTPASIAGMAWSFGVPPLLVRHPFRTDRVLPHLNVPVLLFHGTRDGVVPVRHSRRLHQLAPDSRLIEFDTDHNDVFTHADAQRFWAEIDTLLQRVLPSAPQYQMLDD